MAARSRISSVVGKNVRYLRRYLSKSRYALCKLVGRYLRITFVRATHFSQLRSISRDYDRVPRRTAAPNSMHSLGRALRDRLEARQTLAVEHLRWQRKPSEAIQLG